MQAPFGTALWTDEPVKTFDFPCRVIDTSFACVLETLYVCTSVCLLLCVCTLTNTQQRQSGFTLLAPCHVFGERWTLRGLALSMTAYIGHI